MPATPSNIGVFQLAVISVLHTGFGISTADALAYGVILQAVEIATAVALGLPALVREGLTWSDLRVQALSTAPVRLDPKPTRAGQPAVKALTLSLPLAINKLRCISLGWRGRRAATIPRPALLVPERAGIWRRFHPAGCRPALSGITS